MTSTPRSRSAVASAPDVRDHVVGRTTVVKLKEVEPNTWNPNEMDGHQKMALRESLKKHGWLASDSMLIWGKDETGAVRNVIINGEHRWEEAIMLGWEEGPAAVIDGLTEAQAKAWTMRLVYQRGEPDDDKAAAIVRDLSQVLEELGVDDLAFDLGLADDELKKLLGELGPPPAPPGSSQSNRKTVPLYFDEKGKSEFGEMERALRQKFDTKTVTETVVEAMRRVK